tara:strand:+ start:761 stop:874 length:114 start_codon:yes stop_codon:yes gene_type:complete
MCVTPKRAFMASVIAAASAATAAAKRIITIDVVSDIV